MYEKKDAPGGGNQTRGLSTDPGSILPRKPTFVDHKTISLETVDKLVDALIHFSINRDDQLPVKTGGGQTRAKPESLRELLRGHIVGNRVDPTTAHCWSDRKRHYWREFGFFRCGSYLPGTDNKSKFSVIDIDGGAGHKYPVKDVKSAAITIALNYFHRGFKPYIESSASSSGFHIWTFFDPPADAGALRALAFSMIPKDIPLLNGGFADPRANHGIEVFPKQDRIAFDGFGSVVWLPFWCGARPGGNQFYHLKKGEF